MVDGLDRLTCFDSASKMVHDDLTTKINIFACIQASYHSLDFPSGRGKQMKVSCPLLAGHCFLGISKARVDNNVGSPNLIN